MTDSWEQMEAEIERRFRARLAELGAEGAVVFDQQIDPDDVSTDEPQLWCIVTIDDEVVRRRMSQADVDAFLADRPHWVSVWEVHDRIQDEVRES